MAISAVKFPRKGYKTTPNLNLINKNNYTFLKWNRKRDEPSKVDLKQLIWDCSLIEVAK